MPQVVAGQFMQTQQVEQVVRELGVLAPMVLGVMAQPILALVVVGEITVVVKTKVLEMVVLVL